MYNPFFGRAYDARYLIEDTVYFYFAWFFGLKILVFSGVAPGADKTFFSGYDFLENFRGN